MHDVLKHLKQEGYKLTQPRREILEVLSSNPLSAQEISDTLMKKGSEVDLVTIYRTLELFNKLGFTRKIQFEEKTSRYELIAGQKHHHHLVCQECGDVKDVPVNEKGLIKKVEHQSKFKVQRHVLEFFGLCLKCQ